MQIELRLAPEMQYSSFYVVQIVTPGNPAELYFQLSFILDVVERLRTV